MNTLLGRLLQMAHIANRETWDLFRTILLTMFCLFWSQSEANDLIQSEDVSIKSIPNLTNITWHLLPKKKDVKEGQIANMDSLQKFFKRYEYDDPISYSVEVTEDDYLLGKYNGMTDYKVSEEIARAIFRLLNLDYASKLFLIDTDLRVLYAFCDFNWDKRITEREFNRGLQMIFRPLPFAVMFLRHDSNADEIIDQEEFYELANSWDINGNSKINDMELSLWWTNGGYGVEEEAERFFKTMDNDENGILDNKDLKLYWHKLTAKDTELLDFDEFVRLDTLVNGVPDLRKSKEGKKKLIIHSGRFREFNDT